MSTFERVYTDEQRDAAVSAYLDRGIRPQRRIVELARDGKLVHQGEALEPFRLNAYTLRDMLVQERKRRAGRVRGETSRVSHEDAIEALRVRLLNLAESEILAMERQHQGKRDPERIRQIVRCVREVAAMPAKGEGRGLRPGEKKDGKQETGHTTGMGASLLTAARRRPAPERPIDTGDTTENGAQEPSATQAEAQAEDSEQDAVPGSLGRVAARLAEGTHTRALVADV